MMERELHTLVHPALFAAITRPGGMFNRLPKDTPLHRDRHDFVVDAHITLMRPTTAHMVQNNIVRKLARRQVIAMNQDTKQIFPVTPAMRGIFTGSLAKPHMANNDMTRILNDEPALQGDPRRRGGLPGNGEIAVGDINMVRVAGDIPTHVKHDRPR